MALTTIKVEHYLSGASRQEQAVIRYPLQADIRDLRVLLVDDVDDTGDTLDIATRHLQTFAPSDIRTAVMHHKTTTRFGIDYYAKKVIKWRWLIYPWAIYEDIAGFVQRLSPPPQSLADARQRLADQFDIAIPLQRLEDVCNCMNIPIGRQPSIEGG
jgi:hypoxanthine phosphoribosyltransferase